MQIIPETRTLAGRPQQPLYFSNQAAGIAMRFFNYLSIILLYLAPILEVTAASTAPLAERHKQPEPSQASMLDSVDVKAGSSLGIGLSGLADWSTQHPLLDLMRWSRPWMDWDKRSAEGIELNDHGWVTKLAPRTVAETVFLTTPDNLPIIYKHYIVRWEGKGEFHYPVCAKVIGRAHGGDRIEVGTNSCTLKITRVDERDPLRNITIVPEKHIAAFDRGEVFNPDFVEKITGFRAVRFMDWMNTNGSQQKQWQDRSKIADRSYVEKGAPLELMIAFANKIGADPWFTLPHMADKNYIRQFALLVKQQLNPDLIAYVEHSNELWNWGFPQTQFALQRGREIWNEEGDAFLQWHGMRTAQICDIWKQEVFVDQPQRVRCVLGAQLSWPGAEQAALDCPLWVSQGNKPCYQHGFDAVAVAGYFSGCLNGGENGEGIKYIHDWLKTSDGGLKKSFEQVSDGRYFECDSDLVSVKSQYAYFHRETKKRGMSLVAYEGGQHITSNGGATQNDEKFVQLHLKMNRHPLIKQAYQQNFKNWQQAGGTLFMHFVDISGPSKYGSWGALEYLTQPTSPKWEALIETNAQTCWWENCEKE